jgi:hypothetical protein
LGGRLLGFNAFFPFVNLHLAELPFGHHEQADLSLFGHDFLDVRADPVGEVGAGAVRPYTEYCNCAKPSVSRRLRKRA